MNHDNFSIWYETCKIGLFCFVYLNMYLMNVCQADSFFLPLIGMTVFVGSNLLYFGHVSALNQIRELNYFMIHVIVLLVCYTI